MTASGGDALIPSSQRPIPLVARRDISARPVNYQGEQYWVIKDPLNLEYYRLQPEQYLILRLLDGTRSSEQIRAEFMRRFPTKRPTLSHIHNLIFDLYQKGLAWSARPGQGEALQRRAGERRWRKLLGAMRSLLFIKLPGFDPHGLIKRLYPATRWLFAPLTVFFAVLLIAGAWGLLAVRFDDFQRRLPEFQQLFTWQTLVVAWLTLGAAKILHELGHALACRHFGGECHEIGLAFLVFSPCLYCDVSDSWVLPSKWKRMAIASAGMYVELILSAVALLLWWNTNEGLFNHICLNVFLVTSITTLVFNLNPLLRLDGYYILSDWLEIPNLRGKSDNLFERWFARSCLGARVPDDPFLPQRGRPWFVLFSIASAIYRWFLVFVISFILYGTLKPYRLHNLGLILGIVAAAVALVGLIRGVVRLIGKHRNEIRKSYRPAASLIVAAGVVAAMLFMPFPMHVEAPLVIEPSGVRHIYNSTPGRIAAVLVQPGQYVRRGDVLAELENTERQDRLRALQSALDVQQIEVAIHQARGDATQEAIAQENLRAITEEVADYERQLRRLVITAPCDGRVISAPPIGEPTLSSARKSLPRWHGTPLDPANVGCYLEAGTHLLSIAPNDRYQAVLVVDQFDRPEFDQGSAVKMKIDHLPGRTFQGRIERIATGTLELDDSHAAGGKSKDLMAAAASPFTQSTPAAYQATVPLACNERDFLPGVRGHARILIARRSAADWLWRYFRKTFNFFL